MKNLDKLSEESLEAFGQVLSSKSGRRIWFYLTTQEKYGAQISKELLINPSTVYYHLKKIEKIEVSNVTKKRVDRTKMLFVSDNPWDKFRQRMKFF